MTIEELKQYLGDNKPSYSKVSMAELANIMIFVNVCLKMNEKTLDYYYSINVDELLKSKMPTTELDTLKDDGWSLSDDESELFLYLNIV